MNFSQLLLAWMKTAHLHPHRGCVTLWPCHLLKKSILRQTKNYGNKIISPCKNLNFQKSSKRNQNPSRYYNSMTNLKFQHKPNYHLFKKSSYKNRPVIITQGPKSNKLLYSIMNLNTLCLPQQARANKSIFGLLGIDHYSTPEKNLSH